MANTRKDHKALLKTFGIKEPRVLVAIPNKVSKRMRKKFKSHSSNHWDILRRFHPKLFFNLISKLKGKK